MPTVRFATGSPEGPHATVWRLWTGPKGDTYLAGRATAGKLKASLHVSGRWRFAVTRANAEGPDPLIDPRRDRAVHKWHRPREFAPGLTHAVQIGIAGVDVDSPPTRSATGKVEWVAAPSDAEVGVFDVILSRLPYGESDWPGRTGIGTRPIFHAHLPTGEIVWLLWRVERASPDFWITREQAVRQHLPPRGRAPHLDTPTATSRAILGGEFGGRALLIDVSLTAVERQGNSPVGGAPDSVVPLLVQRGTSAFTRGCRTNVPATSRAPLHRRQSSSTVDEVTRLGDLGRSLIEELDQRLAEGVGNDEHLRLARDLTAKLAEEADAGACPSQGQLGHAVADTWPELRDPLAERLIEFDQRCARP